MEPNKPQEEIAAQAVPIGASVEAGVKRGRGSFFGDLDSLHIMYGGELINRGVLLEGLRIWSRVAEWGAPALALAEKTVEPDLLANAVAEQFHGGFDGRDAYGIPGFVAGALLGIRAAYISTYYDEAESFITRLVGLRYDQRLLNLDDIEIGDPVVLLWEAENPYDPKAVRVFTKMGNDLGFIRRPIAHRLVDRIKAGASLSGRVEVLLGEEFGPNERVYVRVKISQERRRCSCEKLLSRNG